MENFGEKISFIWAIADLLRGPYKPNQYKDVILPMVVIRRLDCVLESTKDGVLKKLKALTSSKVKNLEPILNKVSGHQFHNTSKYTFERLKGDPNNIAANLVHYIKGFSSRAREIIQHFGFEKEIENLEKSDLLYMVVSKFCEIDLHPDKVSNVEMGYIFEELIRRFNEISNEAAGEHFTPREVIRLMVDLLFIQDKEILTTQGIVKTLYDPACGTGGMLSVAEEYLRELNPAARLEVFGQDINPQAYAICGSDMMIKGQSLQNIRNGDSFKEDFFPFHKFDYMLANPPFGVDWKQQATYIKREHEKQGFGGRFGAGLPRVNDGALLFLQHMISKMKEPKDGGTRLAIVFNGSPLFTGSATSGESKIRKWIIENDWLEAVIALPDQLFYNTGINTYLWIVTNRKERKRKGRIQLINAVDFFKKMRRKLGEKRNEIGDEQCSEIVKIYTKFQKSEFCRIFDNAEFAYYRVTLDRPLRLNFAINEERIKRVSETKQFQSLATSKKKKGSGAAEEIAKGIGIQQDIIGILHKMINNEIVKNRTLFVNRLTESFELSGIQLKSSIFKAIVQALSEKDSSADICIDKMGNPEADTDLRYYENIPLKDDIHEYLEREVRPHVPDVWLDKSKTRIGYEINMNRYYYRYTPPRKVKEIEKDLRSVEDEIMKMIQRFRE